MYICMYVYIYIYVCMHVYVCVYIYIYHFAWGVAVFYVGATQGHQIEDYPRGPPGLVYHSFELCSVERPAATFPLQRDAITFGHNLFS